MASIRNDIPEALAYIDDATKALVLWNKIKLKAGESHGGESVYRLTPDGVLGGLSITFKPASDPAQVVFRLSGATGWGTLDLKSEHFVEQGNDRALMLPTPADNNDFLVWAGRLRVRFSGTFALAFSGVAGGGQAAVALSAAGKAEITASFNVFWKQNEERWLGLPIQVTQGGAFAFEFTASVEAAVVAAASLPFLQWSLPAWSAAEVIDDVLGKAAAALAPLKQWAVGVGKKIAKVLQGLEKRRWFEDVSIAGVEFYQPVIRAPDPAQDNPAAVVVIENLGATASIGGKPLKLTGGALALDKNLCVLAEGSMAPALEYVVDQPWEAQGGRLLKVVIAMGAKVRLNLDPRDPHLAIAAPDGGATPVRAMLPADLSPEKQFVFHFDGDDPAKNMFCRIGADGARMKATLQKRAIDLGDAFSEVCLEDGGFLQIDRDDFTAEVSASARLSYFQRASGRLTVRASSKGDFSVQFEPRLEGTWEDPTGCLEFLDPSLTLTLACEGGNWKPDGSLSGTVRLKQDCALLADAREWLDELVGSMELRFEKLNLRDLFGGAPFVSFRFHNLGKSINLWKVLKFELLEFELNPAQHTVVLGGNVHLTLEGGCYFMAGMSGLKMKLGHGASISLADDEPGRPLTLRGKLTTPAGLRAAIELQRERSATSRQMAGHGTLQVPGWSDFGITVGFGRSFVNKDGDGTTRDPSKDGKWIGVFFLFVEADIPVTLYPCIVLRDMGLGFGINKQLRGFDRLRDEKAFDALMDDPRGLPNPAAISDWQDAGSYHHTDVTIVARTHVTVSPEGRGPFPYVADATLYVKPTGDFTFAFYSNVWLFTGLDAVRKPEFRSKPLMQTVLVMYPRNGYLEARSKTRKDFRMEAVPSALSKMLSIFEAEFSLKASPDMFRLRLGPVRAEFKMAGFQLQGSMLHAVELRSGTALMLFHQQLSGSLDFKAGFSVHIGPAHISAGLEIHARAGYSILYAGGFLGSDAGGLAFYGRARAWLSIDMSVWLDIEFRISFKVLWKRITISWSVHFSASISLSFDAEIEMLIGTSDQAMRGRGRLHFSMCGFDFSPSISFSAGGTDALDRCRQKLEGLLPDNYLLLN